MEAEFEIQSKPNDSVLCRLSFSSNNVMILLACLDINSSLHHHGEILDRYSSVLLQFVEVHWYFFMQRLFFSSHSGILVEFRLRFAVVLGILVLLLDLFLAKF